MKTLRRRHLPRFQEAVWLKQNVPLSRPPIMHNRVFELSLIEHSNPVEADATKATRRWRRMMVAMCLTMAWMRHPAHQILFYMGRRSEKKHYREEKDETVRAIHRMYKHELEAEAMERGLRMQPAASTMQLRAAVRAARQQDRPNAPTTDPDLKGLSRLKKAQLQDVMTRRKMPYGDLTRDEMILKLQGWTVEQVLPQSSTTKGASRTGSATQQARSSGPTRASSDVYEAMETDGEDDAWGIISP